MAEILTKDEYSKSWQTLASIKESVTASLPIKPGEAKPDTIIGDDGTWSIELMSEEGILIKAIATRFKCEAYSFIYDPDDEVIHASASTTSQIVSPQLNNMAITAVGKEVAWRPAPTD